MKKSALTAERLREVLKYDPETGVFTRWLRRYKRYRIAGRQRIDGYRDIMVDCERHNSHRLAWLYMTGSWPKEEIDHINGVLDDNRFVNLREATRNINAQNLRKARRDNKLGILGVSPAYGRFKAQIVVRGRTENLGLHNTPDEARAAYIAAKRRLHEGNTL